MHAHLVPEFEHFPAESRGPQQGALASLHCELAVQTVAHFLLPAPSSKQVAPAEQHWVPHTLAVGQHCAPRHVSPAAQH